MRKVFMHCKGMGLLGWIISLPLIVIGLLIAVVIFCEGRKAYWDHRVREMCEMDGGVTVFEKITISDEEYRRLGGVAGGLPLPHKDKVGKDHPYFYQTNEDKIHEWEPEVVRGETIVKRRSDGKILGRSIDYWRRGGDFPTGLFHDSSFSCPEKRILLSKQIFKIKEE